MQKILQSSIRLLSKPRLTVNLYAKIRSQSSCMSMYTAGCERIFASTLTRYSGFGKKSIIIMGLLFVANINAAEMSKSHVTPEQQILASCDNTNFHPEKIGFVLNTVSAPAQPQLFFIKNNSKYSIWLDKANKKNPGTPNAGWASTLDRNRWSALLLKPSDKFELYCSRTISHRLKLVDCQKVVMLCHVNVMADNENSNSSYWVTENQLAKDFLAAIDKRHITLQINHLE